METKHTHTYIYNIFLVLFIGISSKGASRTRFHMQKRRGLHQRSGKERSITHTSCPVAHGLSLAAPRATGTTRGAEGIEEDTEDVEGHLEAEAEGKRNPIRHVVSAMPRGQGGG